MAKKIDTLTIEGVHTQHTVNLYFDKVTGRFSATVVDETFTHKDMKELELLLRAAWRKHESVDFKRYISIDYHARVWAGTIRGGGGNEIGLDRDRDENGRYHSRVVGETDITGISLFWSVCDVSEPVMVKTREGRHQERLWYPVKRGADGAWFRTDVAPWHRETSFADTQKDFERLIPFTEERLLALEAIRRAIAAIDARMVEMFRRPGVGVAELLDSFDVGRLIEAPKTEVLPAPRKLIKKRLSP